MIDVIYINNITVTYVRCIFELIYTESKINLTISIYTKVIYFTASFYRRKTAY